MGIVRVIPCLVRHFLKTLKVFLFRKMRARLQRKNTRIATGLQVITTGLQVITKARNNNRLFTVWKSKNRFTLFTLVPFGKMVMFKCGKWNHYEFFISMNALQTLCINSKHVLILIVWKFFAWSPQQINIQWRNIVWSRGPKQRSSLTNPFFSLMPA